VTAANGGQRGTALVGSMVFLLALTLLAWGYLQVAASEADAVRKRYEDSHIRWETESALSLGLARINRIANPGDQEILAQDTGSFPTFCRIRKLPEARFPRFLVTAEARWKSRGGPVLCTLSAVAQAGTPGRHYFLMEDNAGGSFYFTGDTIDGPVHTNTRFAIAGSPVFLDPVFEMGGGVDHGFLTHPEYATAPVLVKAKPKTGPVYRFDHMSRAIRGVDREWVVRPDPGQVAEIVFKGLTLELRFRDRTLPDGWTAPVTRALPRNGGIFVDGEVEVRGVLGRAVTLGASDDIVITDDLVYADSDPVTAKPRENSATFLGLISEKNVNVRQDQKTGLRGRGIRINASVVAMDKSFQVVNYRAHSWDMGTMRFWGTLTQFERGAIGSVKANDTFRGYHKDWHYDRRLASQPEALPYFPPLVRKDGSMVLSPIYYGPLGWVDADV
jgi:hypothetical protein